MCIRDRPDVDLDSSALSDEKNQRFNVKDGLHCEVNTRIVPGGDGFCFLTQESATSLRLEYARPSLESNPVYHLPLTTPQPSEIIHA